MSKIKNVLSMCITCVLVATLTVGGTIAYLQDEDSDVNVMTLGNVSIVQHEMQRVEGVAYNAGEAGKGNGVKKGALVDFVQNQALYPAVPTDSTAYTAEATDLFYWGDYVYSGTAGNGLWNDEKLSNVMDKMVFVENTGKTDAYVRTIIAFECPEGMEYSEGPDKEFMMNVNGSQTAYSWENLGYETIDGIRYLIMEAIYLKVLEPGNTAHPSLLQVVMTHNATNEDMELLGDTYEIIVVSQAVQADGFADAKTALDEAFGVPDAVDATSGAMRCAEWFGDAVDTYEASQKDTWDGTADTSWYNDTDSIFTLTTAEQFAGLAQLVDDGNSFAGKTINLAVDLDLGALDATGNPVSFDPIGDKFAFEGTFDGQDHTIENLYQSGWAFNYEWGKYGSIGLFGEVKDATIKNVTVSGAEAQIEGGDIGGITGSASGTCVFENITIQDSDFGTYNNGIGGIIGWSGEGNYTFKDITIAEDVVLGGLWGSFDSSIGGVVGQGEPGATYNFEDVDVACRLDAYNDVTAAYKYYIYRMTGMLIGRLEETIMIDERNYPDMSKYNITCKDVTVTYGDWVDYHYCVVAGKTAWRVEPGYAYGGIPADHDHSTCAVCCNLLLPFDGLFGGGQYGVNPITEYDGVTVTYNKK